MHGDHKPEIVEKVTLNEKQAKARRSRNIAIAWCLVVLVVIFWAATVFKIGSNIVDRPF